MLRFLSAVVVLSVLAIAVPVGLVITARARFGGPTPWSGLSAPGGWDWAGLLSSSGGGMTDAALTDVVIRIGLSVVWVATVVLVGSIIAETVHLVRHDGISLPAIRGLGLAQSVARLVAGGLLAAVPLTVVGGQTLALEPFAHPSTDLADDPVVGDTAHGSSVRRMGAVRRSATATSPAVPSEYVVVEGDSIYGIAERLVGGIGTADYAGSIVQANLGREVAPGQRLVNAAYIEPGWVLVLPPIGARVEPIGSTDDHVVEPGETLWSIAEDELGDGRRWAEIFDRNEGREFADGQRMVDPDLIRPGWDLQIPRDIAESVVDDAVEVLDIDVVMTGRGVTAAGEQESAGGPIESSPPASTVSGATVEPRSSDGMPRSTDVSGSTTASALPTEPPGGPLPAGDSEVAPRATTGEVVERVNSWSQADVEEISGTDLVTLRRAGALVAGLLLLVGIRRRTRLRASTTCTTAPPIDKEMVSFERWLRAVDHGDPRSRLDIAIGHAAPVLTSAGERPVVAEVSAEGHIVLHLSGPVGPIHPWTMVDAATWRLDAAASLERSVTEAATGPNPCPTLVQIGVSSDGDDVLVDLEALGALQVDGPPEAVEAVMSAMALSVSSSPAAEAVSLVSVGVDPTAFLGHRRHRSMTGVPEAIDAALEPLGSTLRRAGSTFELRVGSAGDLWDPSVVFIGLGSDPVHVPAERTGLAVVSAAPIDSERWCLLPDGDAWVLDPLGIRLAPVGVGQRALDAVGELVEPMIHEPESIDDRTLPPVVDDVAETDIDGFVEAVDPSVKPMLDVEETPQVLVRLLGPVCVETVDGGRVEFDRSKSLELVAWLSLHRDRSTRSGARTALWDLDVRDATFANVVSDARRAIARAVAPPDGDEWIGRTLTEELPLHPGVRTDADMVRAATDAAQGRSPAEAIAILRPAVQLLVGMPFEGTGYLWPDAEGLTSNLVLLATSAASELASHCLAEGDIDGVFDATERGLRVLPGHEGLIGLRLRAHGRAGDRAGVRHEWEQYERALHADPWADGEPAPSLVRLRHELLAN